MTETFVLRGDPSGIRASAATWQQFSTDAGDAATDIRGTGTDTFVGDEADLYRSRINDDMVPHLDITATAWSIVASALTAYASTLEDLQSRMAALATKAANQRSDVDAAHRSVDSARTADRQHAADVRIATASLKPGEILAPSSYVSGVSAANTALTGANAALQATIDAAATVRGEHRAALQLCGAEIDRAKHLRFVRPPGFLGHLKQSVCDWVSDHAGMLLQVSSVLKTISAISGVLALIPPLAPVMAPISLATGAAALTIDIAVKLVTGQGSWTQIAIDGVGLIPGVKSLSAFGRAAESATVVSRGLAAMGEAKTAWKVIDTVSGVATVGLTTYQAVAEDGSFVDVGTSVLGVSIPGVSHKFEAMQNIVSSTAGLVGQGWAIADKYRNGKKVGVLEWVNALTAAGGVAAHSGRAIAYHEPGRNPNGQFRAGYAAPDYKFRHTVKAAGNMASSISALASGSKSANSSSLSGSATVPDAANNVKNSATAAASAAKAGAAPAKAAGPEVASAGRT